MRIAASQARILGRRRVVAIALSVAVVGFSFAYLLPQLAGYGAVWQIVRSLGWWWLLALLGATALNIATFAPPWMIALPGLGFVRSIQLTQASTAFSLVMPGGAPLGMAASFAILRSGGFDRSRSGVAVTLTGLWNQVSTFLFPILAL